MLVPKKTLRILLFFLFWPTFLFGQSDRAGLVGVVSDTSGAVLPGVDIRVINVDTGPAFSTVTDGNGRYTVPSILKVGTYIVEAALPGFKKTRSRPTVLQIGDVKEVNLQLEVGEITEEVTVTSESPMLEGTTSSIGETITGRQVVELPLKDRNFTQLATLVPGVSRAFVGILTDQTAFNQGNPGAGEVPGLGNAQGSTEASRFSRSGGSSISTNGVRPTQNNFSLDGVDNNEPQFGSIGVFPNPDAIGEFKVETSVPKAESGRGGAQITTTLKSGINDFHGSLYYFGQNDNLNANGAITNKRGVEKPEFRVNEFGFTLGGPVIKNRTFFFVDYLGQRNATPFDFQTVVPTAKSRTGDFSEFDAPVINPTTGEPFPGNVIRNPQSLPGFSPQALELLSRFPLPTRDVRNPSFGNPNFFGLRDNSEKINSFDVKIDHRVTDSNHLTGRFSLSNQKRTRGSFFEELPAGFGAGDEKGNTRQIAINDTHVFNPNLINEFRFGWTRVDIGILNPGVGGTQGISETICEDIGIPNCNKGNFETSGLTLLGGFGTGEFEFVGDGGPFRSRSDNVYFADTVTFIKGSHTFKTGTEIRPRFIDIVDGGRSGFLKGHFQWAAGITPDSTGNVQADMLLGVPAIFAQSGTLAGGPFDGTATEWSFFVQDDWKVTDRLTLNLGLRYDLFTPLDEANDRRSNFLVDQSRLVAGSGLFDEDTDNFGPRIGFAYRLSPEKRLVLRGGYALLYAQDGVDLPPTFRNPPNINTITFGEFAGNRGNFNLTTGPPVAPVQDVPVITPQTSVFFSEPDQTVSEIQQWQLSLQWEFVQNWLLDIGYVGSHSTHLLATRQLGNNGNGLGLARTPDGQILTDAVGFENRASAIYHGLQTKLEKRFSKGFEFRTSYTWSHNIDDSTGVFNGAGEQRAANGGPVNPLSFENERGSSSLNVRHLFSTNLIWDLPFGRGRPFLTDLGGAAQKILGGWQTNIILSGRTGQPFTVGCDSPTGQTRCEIVGDPFANVPSNKFLNPNAFAAPSQVVINDAGKEVFFGNQGRNVFEGPGFFRTDLSLFKNTDITETVSLQFGVEFFNVFNHNDGLVPNQFLGNPAAGDIRGNFGEFDNALPPRQIQYRLKIIF